MKRIVSVFKRIVSLFLLFVLALLGAGVLYSFFTSITDTRVCADEQFTGYGPDGNVEYECIQWENN